MVAVFVLVAGVLFMLVVGAIVLTLMGMTQVLILLVPIAPMLIAVGCFLLGLTEVLLLFGGKDDRRTAVRDLSYIAPTLIISTVLWYAAQLFLG